MCVHVPAARRGEPLRVVVVDDHRTFSDLVRLALDHEPDLACVATARDAAEARARVLETRPDVVLMDVDLGPEDGLRLTEELRVQIPSLRVVVLTAHCDASVMRRTAAAGACALLPKGEPLPDLLRALRHARLGELYVHPGLLPALVAEGSPSRHHHQAPLPALTPRETHVLQLLADGRSVTEIARLLGISVHTCRGYVKTLLAKLGAHSQLEAVAVAGRLGILDAPAGR
ncbi:response regulator [Nocardioides aequoreus]|uniref:response regulator n=1 Tax=Nocardioides aequoreus TaxID=397278 RepID=UPI0004C441A8|nr:response regulator transcription factor [Nocardioides aequoreus]